jgi:hypothetical protein
MLATEGTVKIEVLDDAGLVKFSFDPSIGGLSSLAASDRTAVINALHDAQAHLAHDGSVIASINADIRSAVSRIEVELGAHPAFTWAQTKLGNAIAHLEAFVKGTWTEPTPMTGVVLDNRGVNVAPAPAAAPTAAEVAAKTPPIALDTAAGASSGQTST